MKLPGRGLTTMGGSVFREVTGLQGRLSLHLLFFKCFQFKIINIPKQHVLGWHVLNSFRIKDDPHPHNHGINRYVLHTNMHTPDTLSLLESYSSPPTPGSGEGRSCLTSSPFNHLAQVASTSHSLCRA